MSSSINNVFIEGSEGGIDSGAKKVLDSTQVQAHQKPKTVTLKLGKRLYSHCNKFQATLIPKVEFRVEVLNW